MTKRTKAELHKQIAGALRGSVSLPCRHWLEDGFEVAAIGIPQRSENAANEPPVANPMPPEMRPSYS